MRNLRRMTLGILILATLQGCDNGHEQRKRESELLAQIDSLRALVQNTPGLPDDWRQRNIIERLEREGLEDPLVALAKDLKSHPELIPANPVPEGMAKFGFYGDESVHALNDKWVLADFSDGHGEGQMILQYSIDDSGVIRWTPLLWAWDSANEKTHVMN
jgi:hypothetical protein